MLGELAEEGVGERVEPVELVVGVDALGGVVRRDQDERGDALVKQLEEPLCADSEISPPDVLLLRQT